MDKFLGVIGVLVIAVCAIVLVISGYCAVIFLGHPDISGPLFLTAIVCAAIIFGILTMMKGGRR